MAVSVRNLLSLRVTDSFLWILAVPLAGFLRLELGVFSLEPLFLLSLGFGMALISYGSGRFTGLYGPRSSSASFDEFVSLLWATAATTLFSTVALLILGPVLQLPRSLPILSSLIFLALSGSQRVFGRYRKLHHGVLSNGERALVYGAGYLAEALISQLLRSEGANYVPIGLLDDDRTKVGSRISGIPVLGGMDQLEEISRAKRASTVIVAIAAADSRFLQRIQPIAERIGLKVLVMPGVNEILADGGKSITLSSLSIEELIGRRAVVIDNALVASQITGRSVLVTGAGGSIGSELSRQIAGLRPRELYFLDRDETGLQQAQLVSYGSGLLDNPNLLLADIREKQVVDRIFAEVRPDVVFHAAALKHLPMLERFPEEAWKTNVLGTLNLLQAARNFDVETFVNISTDKAADPSSVLGRSKLIGERLTRHFDETNRSRFVSVRFGNVLGSRGSLVPTLAYLIEKGLPISITHRDATRYFMTIREACQLVLNAAGIQGSGDVFILDMGDPVKILEVAERMFEMAGSRVDIRFTGLRKGEKLEEQLHSKGIPTEPTAHPLIAQMSSLPLSSEWVRNQTHKVLTMPNLDEFVPQ